MEHTVVSEYPNPLTESCLQAWQVPLYMLLLIQELSLSFAHLHSYQLGSELYLKCPFPTEYQILSKNYG